MLEEKIFLTENDILEKQFKLDARGYRPQEVDKFLDLIIRDYVEYKTIIKRQSAEIKSLESDNQLLQSELRDLKSKMEIVKANSTSGITNVDIIKRISELEKIVYGEW